MCLATYVRFDRRAEKATGTATTTTVGRIWLLKRLCTQPSVLSGRGSLVDVGIVARIVTHGESRVSGTTSWRAPRLVDLGR